MGLKRRKYSVGKLGKEQISGSVVMVDRERDWIEITKQK